MQISVEENASSISEDLDITKPEESSPADSVEQLKEPEIINIDSTTANEPEVPVEDISVLIEGNKDDINPIESEIPVGTNLDTDSFNAEVSVESPVAISEQIDENVSSTETAMDKSGTGQLDERIIETSVPPITEEIIVIAEEEARTEEPTMIEVITENVTPILSITEEPKTSQPIAEMVTPAETNLEESVTEVPKKELEQDRGDVNIEERPETVLTENKVATESSIENGPSEIVNVTDNNSENSLAAQDATIKDDKIETSSGKPLSEPNVITATESISTATTVSESDSMPEKDKTEDDETILSADSESATSKIELAEEKDAEETAIDIANEATEVKPADDKAILTAPSNPKNEGTEVSNVELSEEILTIPLESEELASEVSEIRPSEEKITK